MTYLVTAEPHPSNAGHAKAAITASASSATQRLTVLPADTLSQADILVIHRLTLVADVKAVGNLASTYARDLGAILKGVRNPGQAIIADDTAERAVVSCITKTS